VLLSFSAIGVLVITGIPSSFCGYNKVYFYDTEIEFLDKLGLKMAESFNFYGVA